MHNQRVPNVDAKDVQRIVRRDFPDQEYGAVMSLLDEYGAETWHREHSRVRIGILKLAHGDLGKLRSALTVAKKDYRDILSPAEYPRYSQRVFGARQLSSDEEISKIIEEDWEQYETWLRG